MVGPCTVPVLSGILAVATESGSTLYAGIMLFSFSLGLGALLVLAGTFAGFMVALPKGGKWMIWIKFALGVGLLAVAAYYSYLAYESF
ncbi:MAG: cytochrome c biogenesis protein CcdA [Planctomycetota bacterium]|nr:cytochrome c biogenesis protein CcdA [Planctomycetota bacterium]